MDLFPPIDPYRTGYLEVDGGHTLYWEESGRPDGMPVIFLHGGPGAGSSPEHRRFFNPAHYRIVILDQRGAGRSRPLGRIEHNTTQHLLADLEMLREHLGIERWLVFGGSWGSTLGLAYAQAHPQRCLGLVLRGIFLGREAEVDWFLSGMGRFFPEAEARFLAPIPREERGDLLTAYLRRLTDPDPKTYLPAARAWSVYEGTCATLMPSPETVAAFGHDDMALSLARLEAHYFANALFLRPNQLLEDMARIVHLPAVIVQGRYDVICPPNTARELAAAWPGTELKIVPDAGHSAMEPGIRAALVAATEAFKGWPAKV